MPSWLVHWQGILDTAAAVASILGLLFSFLAWRKAASAETAAREAREAIRRSNAGEDLRALGEKAQELLSCAQNEQIEAALLRSRDLLAGIAQARHRWQAFFMEDSLKQIAKAAKEIGRVSRAFSAGPEAITPQVREKLLKSCHEVTELLAEELGKALRRADGVVSQ
jgi:hypothetical protein